MNPLIAFDHYMFEKINSAWTNPVFDWLFPRITDLHKNPYFFAAVLPLLAYWIWKQRAYALKSLLILVISVALSDTIAYRVLKATVQRDRPVEAGLQVQLRTHHHSGTSFPSNHAANMFAAAQSLTLANPAYALAFYAVAFAVAYSRVYVGVHFPMDVTCGALLGLAISTLIWMVFRKWVLKSRADGSG